MTLRPRATEIPELVRKLGSRIPAHVDAARARLSMIGARAVDALVEALDGENVRVRTNAMALLALIQDPRGREALAAMLLDKDTRLRATAARCLARFAAPEAVAALARTLVRERAAEVRHAAVDGLVSLCEAGQDGAVSPVLGVLLDTEEEVRVRAAALALLPLLRAAERRGIVRRLVSDKSAELARRARDIDEAPPALTAGRGPLLDRVLRRLAHPSYSVWHEAVHALASHGGAAVVPLVEEMQRRSHDPEYCARAAMALKALGPRRGRALAAALVDIEEPLPLQVLVEVTGALGEKSLIYRLKDLIGRLRPFAPAGANGFDPMARVRAKAHLEIARVGSRCAIDDLRALVARPDARVEAEAIEALELIGKKDEIPDLLGAYTREDRFTRGRIALAVRAIMRRERIRRNSRMFRTLGPDERRALEAIVPAAARRPAPRATRRAARR